MRSILLGIVVLCGLGTVRAAPIEVPEALRAWVPWVLDDVPDHACPFLFNAPTRRCLWPGRLAIAATTGGASFTVGAEVFQRSWVPLPGRPGLWPQRVTDHGEPIIVVRHGGVPAVELDAGHHELAGAFDWPALPEVLPVPAEYGLVTLTVDGRPLPIPNQPGQIWLKPTAPTVPGDEQQERLEVQVFRRLVDRQPLEVVTQLELDVAGAQREITLTGAQLPDTVPMALDSPLPARLESNGDLRLQVRPGHWQLQLTTRHRSALTVLPLPAHPAPWPTEEIWVFEAQPALRLVEITGAPTIDPRQTRLPAEWQSLPTYRLASGEALKFQVQRRGDPEPEPDRLDLVRELWLDFDGAGMTVSDALNGQMTRAWRLQAGPRLALGRVALNGEPQFVTTLDGRQRGVEVRRGTVTLSADSRLDGDVREFPAVGWAMDVNSLAVTLNLPPGWRLWSARGVDNVPQTWLHRWTLLDLFLVLIATVAVARLWHWRWALLALVTLTALWHEAGAPRQIWLHLLVALALLRVLPAGRLRGVVNTYRNVVVLGLLAASVTFMVSHLRVGLYPQLEQPYGVVGADGGARVADVADQMAAPPEAPTPTAEMAVAEMAVAGTAAVDAVENEVRAHAKRLLSRQETPPPDEAHTYDPQAVVQTGPGLPEWRWTSIPLTWNGPVASGQTLSLVLLSPRVNLCLAVLRVALLAALLAFFLRAAFARGAGPTRAGGMSAAALVLGLLALGGPPAAHAAYPDPALLDTLKQRLLRAPTCQPECAEIPRAQVTLTPQGLTLHLDVQTAAEVGLPLPGRADQWLAEEILVDERPASGLWRAADGTLWLALAPGSHRVWLAGSLPARANFELPFQLVPQRVTTDVAGWSIDGVRPDGSVDSQLLFTRAAARPDTALEALEARALPPFFRVTRTLRLGLDWRVDTVVERLTPPGVAAALEIPLLADESVTTPDVRVDHGRVQATIAADQATFTWTSVLAQRAVLELTAAPASDWGETWRLDLAPVWHAEIEGIPVVHHQNEAGQWLPEWQPWPGERVRVAISRPAGVPGQTLTIDRSHLHVVPGHRATDGTLAFSARSSQGGQHTLRLPRDAVLQSVTIDGTPQPIRQDGAQVTLPLAPTTQQFVLTWRSDEALGTRFATPAFSLGAPSVNSRLSVQLPADRWTLFTGGPRLGPAVLFWGVAIVIGIVAVGLGRTRLTPLTSWQWALLAIGLSQTDVASALVVVGWLFALALRPRLPALTSRWHFNLVQIGLAVLTLVALACLFQAIQRGLLGTPDMQIAGNGSSALELNWFQDRAGAEYPTAFLWSVSLWWYRGLMLAWALWLAFALLNWLRWGWQQATRDGVWRAARLVPARTAQAAGPASEQAQPTGETLT